MVAKYLRCVAVILGCAALCSASGTAYAHEVISLREIPQRLPGYAAQIRYTVIDGRGTGFVFVTNEGSIGAPKVLRVARFQYDPNTFIYKINEYENYKDFYGRVEDSDGRLVEGNPQTVVLSFFADGRMVKSIRLSGTLAYSNKPDGKFQLPVAVIELRNQLSAYTKQAQPQPQAKYYMAATLYSENEKYWLLKSTRLESIPAITDITNAEDRAFLNTLIKNIPIFYATDGTTFSKHRKKYKIIRRSIQSNF